MQSPLRQLSLLIRPGVGPATGRVQFLRFGMVGSLGFLVDTAIVYALRQPLGLYAAGMASYLVAASTNWLLNRVWTFRGRYMDRAHRQWARFLVVNLGGLVLNRGTYISLVALLPLARTFPVLAVAA